VDGISSLSNEARIPLIRFFLCDKLEAANRMSSGKESLENCFVGMAISEEEVKTEEPEIVSSQYIKVWLLKLPGCRALKTRRSIAIY